MIIQRIEPFQTSDDDNPKTCVCAYVCVCAAVTRVQPSLMYVSFLYTHDYYTCRLPYRLPGYHEQSMIGFMKNIMCVCVCVCHQYSETGSIVRMNDFDVKT